ncbi:hypothetical protein N0V90_011261 [Kalmusia sp. IMI 367209]|nr:hypothetical protein N0V90_011261 [Kalmusia sp. IMI 367209]
MAAGSAGQQPSPEFLAETNDPYLDQRVSIAFVVIDTFFLLLFYVSRYFNKKAVGMPMLTWLQLSKVLEFTYTPAVMFAKLAALFLYHQVFEMPVYRRIIIGIGVIIVLQGVVALILAFSICRPFRYFWTQAVDVNDGTCGDVMLFYKSYSIPSLVTDVAMLILPWPILLKLHIPTSEKIGLILTFLAASLGIITCTLRFVVFFTVPLFSDPTWYASGGPMIYALVEPSIYMIASILPTTRHLYRRVRKKARLTAQLRSAKSNSSPKGSNGSHSADGERRPGGAAAASGGAAQADGDWQANRNSSQEELTLGEWYQNPREWNHMRNFGKADKGASGPAPRELVKKQIEVRGREDR